jgi:hypothetical protein
VEDAITEEPSQPVPSLPERVTSPAKTVDMLANPSPIAIEVLSSHGEDHESPPPTNVVSSAVPVSPLYIPEAMAKSPIIVDDVTSLSPAAEQRLEEQDKVMENLLSEGHQHLEFASARESSQEIKKRQGEEEEEEEEQEQKDAEEEEEEGEEDKNEDARAGTSDRVPSPVRDIFEPTQSIQYPEAVLGSEDKVPAPAVLEPEEINEDEAILSGEEPLQVIRRNLHIFWSPIVT